jgi:hypothetical protein
MLVQLGVRSCKRLHNVRSKMLNYEIRYEAGYIAIPRRRDD